MVKWLDVSDVDDEEIAWLGAFNVKWTGQVVDFGEVDVANIVGAVIVSDLTARPV